MNGINLAKIVVLCGAVLTGHSFAQANYTEEQKQMKVQGLAKQVNSQQQKDVDNMDNYNKHIFKANQSLYGGYTDVAIEVPDYLHDESLSDAQRNSIKNYQERAILIKKLVEGEI